MLMASINRKKNNFSRQEIQYISNIAHSFKEVTYTRTSNAKTKASTFTLRAMRFVSAINEGQEKRGRQNRKRTDLENTYSAFYFF
jgi:hypothetical protein